MLGIFKRRDPAVDDLLAKIAQCKAAVPSEAQMVADRLFDILAKVVSREWKKEHLENYKAEVRAGGKPEAFIFNYIVQICGDRLESGRYHVYRGVLNMEGKLYQQLFEHSIATMIAAGEYTKDWADENLRKPVYKGVREVG
jgi:hypothetical protein